ncbi:uncharacterized protein [Narcine bancroftii]|uniref:uncharacterized protein n=1 Tax=Narcine bancroftii TaxID=1343680 RepID=UPI003831B729
MADRGKGRRQGKGDGGKEEKEEMRTEEILETEEKGDREKWGDGGKQRPKKVGDLGKDDRGKGLMVESGGQREGGDGGKQRPKKVGDLAKDDIGKGLMVESGGQREGGDGVVGDRGKWAERRGGRWM